MPAPVLVPFIVLVLVPVLVAGAVAVLVPLIMPVPVPVLVAGGVSVPVPVIMPVLAPLLVRLVMVVCVRLIMVVRAFGIVPISVQMVIMGAVVPSMMPMLVPIIMLALVLWLHAVDGWETGLPTGLAATALEAPRAITPAAKAPASSGRLHAVNFCPSAPLVPISLLCLVVMVNSLVIRSLQVYLIAADFLTSVVIEGRTHKETMKNAPSESAAGTAKPSRSSQKIPPRANPRPWPARWSIIEGASTIGGEVHRRCLRGR